MKTGRSLFKSKVARRIFFLFVCCALIPITVLSVLSFIQVSGELEEQSVARLQKAAKAHGTSIFERFVFLETDLHLISSILPKESSKINFTMLSEEFHQTVFRRFESVSILSNPETTQHLYGQLTDLNPADITDLKKPSNGKIILFMKHEKDAPSRLFMIKWMDALSPAPKMLIGEVDTTYLWGIGHGNILPPLTDFCMVDQYRNVLITSFPVSSNLLHQINFSESDTNLQTFEYADDTNAYFVSHYPMFLKSRFVAPTFMVVLRNNKSNVFAPLMQFKKIFPLVVLLSLWIVLFLSINYIRKSLVPLEKIKEGTLRIAKRDFENRVNVKSGDEFEEVAQSFNMMAGQLNQHFNALTTRSEIDRAILSSLRKKEIIETALNRLYHFFKSDIISIGVLRSKQPDSVQSFIYENGADEKTVEEFLKISSEETHEFDKSPEYTVIDPTKTNVGYLSESIKSEMAVALLLPLFIDNTLSGIIAICHIENKLYGKDDLNHARQLANQVAVALSNAYLIEDLESLNWGTLEALARTVDAKSTWTAGHSERVATIAVKTAQAMGLDQDKIDILQRAAFLHDIGKIGVPLSILDKPAKLTDEEYEIVKDHPSIGAKILEPIETYADVIPIVQQHHEKFNGKGYPLGLSGESISVGARILAVADVYDAVASDRPYRKGWVEDKALKLITENAGKDFDPKVVEAFLSTLT